MTTYLPTASAPLYTDLYQLTMAQGHFLAGTHQQPASFDYFFRRNPFQGGYVIFCGLQEVLEHITAYQFDTTALEFLANQGFKDSFLAFLESFSFQGDLDAPAEAEVVFPYEPVITVRGSIVEAQLIETLLLNLVNFSSLIATKASRIRQVAGDRTLIDFGLRRAPGLGGLQASRAAIVGGFDSTSHVLVGRDAGVPLSGTQAHAWIQCFPDELTAFRTYAEHYPDRCVLLVDTYNTLKSGIPNAIQVARELRARGHELLGVRLDSGDLAYLSRQARRLFDEAGFPDVKIAASNSLDEHVIRSLLRDQDAAIDIFGVGTQLVTAYDHPALDGVYKLSEFNGTPRIKVSENHIKVNFPGPKTVYRCTDQSGRFFCDAIACADEGTPDHLYHPHNPYKDVALRNLDFAELLQPVLRAGVLQRPTTSALQGQATARERLQLLPSEHQRFDNPHIYKVGLSRKLRDLRHQALSQATRRNTPSQEPSS